jgi:shikimate dehydrogenase
VVADPPVRAAVLGRPISHSLSPVLHRAAYQVLGLTEWSYQAIECAEEDLGNWVAPGSQWAGLSLTMPLKQAVMPLLSRVSPLARAVGAVNTVTWDEDRQPVGDNTDVHGIVEALRSAGVRTVGTACILGAGATASSAVAALAELGCREVTLLARSAARAAGALTVASRFEVQAEVAGLDQLDLPLTADAVISTLPSVAAADWAARLALELPARADRAPAGTLLDVSYHPWPTATATVWASAGGVAVGGFEMLLHQAAAQVTLMTGHPAPLEAMRTAGEKALADRY